ncbi:hypothetical protein HHE06_11310 [Helicobacter heilmannii]|uniref:hypothetical protein n=1 Tax=Helicobacter heilmannii TaxID=35817 RepID=UPI0006A07C36|nr:hypothetical protein [Helicobacter heilmannii]CRF51266.1 hypothetical protein HHE06_11310 [Helicobacter heilmannii]
MHACLVAVWSDELRINSGVFAPFLLLPLFLWGSDQIDYEHLDPRYYKYIKFYEAYTDKRVKQLITDIQDAEKKTGLMIGLSTGFFYNNQIRERTGSATITGNNLNYLWAIGVRFGYQTFRPSLFAKTFRPNVVGRRIYIEYIGGVPKQSRFGRVAYQSAMINADLMIDPVLPFVGRYLSVGFILGVGVGVIAQGISTNSFFGMMANTGVAFNFFGHNRVELEFKLLANKDISWWGGIVHVGYQYVF